MANGIPKWEAVKSESEALKAILIEHGTQTKGQMKILDLIEKETDADTLDFIIAAFEAGINKGKSDLKKQIEAL